MLYVNTREGDGTRKRIYKYYPIPRIESEDEDIKEISKIEHDKHVGYIKKLLTEGELHFSNPRRFNDPFDSLIDFSYIGEGYDIEQFVRGLLADTTSAYKEKQWLANFVSKKPKGWIERVREIIMDIYGNSRKNEEDLLNFKIACFADNWDTSPMWGHYASAHYGLCIGFETHYREFLEGGGLFLETKEHPKGSRETIDLLLTVKYSQDRPKPFEICRITDSKERTEKLTEFILSKHSSWEYEQERRLLSIWDSLSKPANDTKHVQLRAIKEIIFGLRTTNDDKDEIIRLLPKEDSLEIFQIFLPDKSYKLERKRIG